MTKKITYECVQIAPDGSCSQWQADNESAFTKQQLNELTVAIVAFMVFVRIWMFIKQLAKL